MYSLYVVFVPLVEKYLTSVDDTFVVVVEVVFVVDHRMAVVKEDENEDEVHYHHYNYSHNFVVKVVDQH